MKTTFLIALPLAAALLAGCKPTPRTAGRNNEPQQQQPQPSPVEEKPRPTPATSLVRVRMATQSFNQLAPWEKDDPVSWNLCGAYLGNGLVLTTDTRARSANVVELSLPDESRTIPGRVVKVDEDAELAIVAPLHEQDAAAFFADSVPLEPGEPLKIGDAAEIWDTGRGGISLATPGMVESGGESEQLLPQVNVKVNQMLSEGSPGVPLVKDGKLVGVASGYEAQSQLITSPDMEVVRRFVANPSADDGGVPVLGASMQILVDPVFRSFLQLDRDGGGVYISEVEPHSSAADAGLRKGDVLESCAGVPVDSRGLSSHQRLGPLSWAAMLRGAHGQGETVDLTVRRHGKQLTLPVELNRDAVNRALIAEEQHGQRPRFIMYGGLLLQPVTKNYLDAFQKRTGSRLPYEYLMIEKNKERYRREGRREVVALSRVIPTPATLGYERMFPCVVDAINGSPVRSLQEAAELLDRATPDNIVTITVNKPPYTLALDRSAVEASNRYLQRRSLPELRYLGEKPASAPGGSVESAPTPSSHESPGPEAPADGAAKAQPAAEDARK